MTTPRAEAATRTEPETMGIELVARRRLTVSPVDAFFRLRPGDRALVKEGEAVGRGQPILEHYREPRTLVAAGSTGDGIQPRVIQEKNEPNSSLSGYT